MTVRENVVLAADIADSVTLYGCTAAVRKEALVFRCQYRLERCSRSLGQPAEPRGEIEARVEAGSLVFPKLRNKPSQLPESFAPSCFLITHSI